MGKQNIQGSQSRNYRYVLAGSARKYSVFRPTDLVRGGCYALSAGRPELAGRSHWSTATVLTGA